MPLPVVSPTLFNAWALPADADDTHLQPGVHLRVSANPGLGLPVAPFVVHRATARGQELTLRSDAVFVDSRGRIAAPPFTLTPDNPVTAYLAVGPGETAVWAQVTADPLTVAPGLDPMRRAPSLPGRARVPPGIVATGYVSTSQGPSPIARRSRPRYAFSGPGLVQIGLEGSGMVGGVQWLEQGNLPPLNFVPWTVLNLPHEGGPRYLSVDGALARALGRVLDQAPRRRPLQETLGATPPAAAPVETPLYEAKRVDSLAEPVAPSLDRLVTDLSTPALELIETDGLFFLTGGPQKGTATQRCLDRVLAAQLDPGGAALLGYQGLDREPGDNAQLLVFYWVSGLFRDFPPSAARPADPIFDAQLAVLGPDGRIGDQAALRRAFEELIKGLDVTVNEKTAGQLESVPDYIGLGALAVADLGAPPEPVLPPAIDDAADEGWLPVTPPAARREVQLSLSGVATAALLAAEKQTPDGGQARVSLNPANDDGYHLPLALSLNIGDETLEPAGQPGTGFLADRQAAPQAVRYYVAQQDPFGRWSDWSSAVSWPGPRPAPPPPVIRATYTQPADPATAGGTILVTAEVPRLEVLAPGSFPISRLELTLTDRTTTAVTSPAGSTGDPLAPDDQVALELAGPRLAPTERRKITVTAVWRDTAGTASAASEPHTLQLNDPRPPAQLAVPDELNYSGRPDVLGLSKVEYAWSPAAGQARFGVFYTDENRLVAYLANAVAGSAEATVRDALAGTTDPAARATLFRANAALFPAGLFERLQDVGYDPGGGQQAFRHAVSGSLRVLNLYRISAESDTNARVDLSTLPLLTFAVPNADPPPRPVLQVTPDGLADNGSAYSATAQIAVTAGLTTASTWRLRRSSLGGTEVLRMPVVATGPMGAVADDGRQRATFADHGPVVISPGARLQPWVRYTYVAEVQGDPAPGSAAAGRPVPGAWSAPSDPVSVMLVPPRAPEPAETVTAAGTSVGGGEYTAVTVAFTHPRVLSGGVAGAYRVRVARRPPGGSFEALAESGTGGGEGPYAVSGMRPGDAADQVAAGTVYRLVIIDPLGRESAAADATLS